MRDQKGRTYPQAEGCSPPQRHEAHGEGRRRRGTGGDDGHDAPVISALSAEVESLRRQESAPNSLLEHVLIGEVRTLCRNMHYVLSRGLRRMAPRSARRFAAI